jgi:hypothetical protein
MDTGFPHAADCLNPGKRSFTSESALFTESMSQTYTIEEFIEYFLKVKKAK